MAFSVHKNHSNALLLQHAQLPRHVSPHDPFHLGLGKNFKPEELFYDIASGRSSRLICHGDEVNFYCRVVVDPYDRKEDIARLVDLTLNDALNLRACNLGAKAIRRQQNFARQPLKNNKGGTGTITDYKERRDQSEIGNKLSASVWLWSHQDSDTSVHSTLHSRFTH